LLAFDMTRGDCGARAANDLACFGIADGRRVQQFSRTKRAPSQECSAQRRDGEDRMAMMVLSKSRTRSGHDCALRV
jgi:hypothetical protein